ncbi:hypothetical protein K3495_g11937 [Podosphaera aphanis]|nr:hypothetical protein K3495_g11937 [Podosphaera aphanis]
MSKWGQTQFVPSAATGVTRNLDARIQGKCPIAGCKSTVGKYCTRHGSYKCTNCGGSHTAPATKFPDYRRAVAVAKADRNEWRDQERRQEERQLFPHLEDDASSISSDMGVEGDGAREKGGEIDENDAVMEEITTQELSSGSPNILSCV